MQSLSFLSVYASNAPNGGGDGLRTIVRWYGGDSCICLACKGSTQPTVKCYHRGRAAKYLKDVLKRDLGEREEVGLNGEVFDMGTCCVVGLRLLWADSGFVLQMSCLSFDEIQPPQERTFAPIRSLDPTFPSLPPSSAPSPPTVSSQSAESHSPNFPTSSPSPSHPGAPAAPSEAGAGRRVKFRAESSGAMERSRRRSRYSGAGATSTGSNGRSDRTSGTYASSTGAIRSSLPMSSAT